jgi:hypothetical protein
MNKLLPILLVVVLSGCGGNAKTTLEKCADSTAEKEGMSWKLTQREQDAIDMPEDEYTSKYFGSGMRAIKKAQEYNKEMYGYRNPFEDDLYGYKNLRKFALIKSKVTLKDKLSNDDYEYYFRQCEDNQSRHPKTFDARWK